MSASEEIPDRIETSLAGWRALAPLWRSARSLAVPLLAIAALDLACSFALSALVPAERYLAWYLDDSEPEVIRRFLAGEAELLPDEAAGWRNRPNSRRGDWVIDEHGARSHRPIGRERERAMRVLFLGSSVINGGTQIRNDQSLSAYLESPEIETINFGTMLYSVDQSLLAYRSRLRDYAPTHLVVGIHSELDALTNVYVPFRNRAERFMPFVKPVFALDAGGLELTRVSPRELLADAEGKRRLLALARERDGAWEYFESYRRLGILPVASSLRWGLLKVRQLLGQLRPDPAGQALQLAIMRRLAEEARLDGAEVLFVEFPRLEELGSGVKGWLLSRGRKRHDEVLRGSGLDVLLVSEIIEGSGRPASELYFEDGVHTTPECNRMIAEAIRERLVPRSAGGSPPGAPMRAPRDAGWRRPEPTNLAPSGSIEAGGADESERTAVRRREARSAESQG